MIFEITEYTRRHSYHSNVCIDENDIHSMQMIDIQNLWIMYMDGISLLQCIDISSMDKSSNDTLCMFLNLYHCLLLHSYLVVGHPSSLMQWYLAIIYNIYCYNIYIL